MVSHTLEETESIDPAAGDSIPLRVDGVHVSSIDPTPFVSALSFFFFPALAFLPVPATRLAQQDQRRQRKEPKIGEGQHPQVRDEGRILSPLSPWLSPAVFSRLPVRQERLSVWLKGCSVAAYPSRRDFGEGSLVSRLLGVKFPGYLVPSYRWFGTAVVVTSLYHRCSRKLYPRMS